jgi:hypothetical protein
MATPRRGVASTRRTEAAFTTIAGSSRTIRASSDAIVAVFASIERMIERRIGLTRRHVELPRRRIAIRRPKLATPRRSEVAFHDARRGLASALLDRASGAYWMGYSTYVASTDLALSEQVGPPGPITVAELRILIDRLPSDARAQLAWAPRAFEVALRALLDEPLTPELVARSAVEVFAVLSRCWLAFGGFAGPQPIDQPSVQQAMLRALRTHLNSPAADAAEWTFRAILAMGEFASSTVSQADQARAATSETSLASTANDPIRGGLIRAEVLLMAILYAVDEEPHTHLDRAEEMADWALIDAATFIRFVEGAGIHLQLFKNESRDEALARQSRYVEHVRDIFTDEVAAVVSQARIRQLR